MSNVPQIKLNNGVLIPAIGTGSWAPDTVEEQSKVKGWILTALQNGYRHIDTAQSYYTEPAAGQAIRESGIPREQIFVTTKLPWNHQECVAQSFEQSLKNLGLDYVDLYLLHWPQPIAHDGGDGYGLLKNADGSIKLSDKINFNQAWVEFEKILESGKARSIGVSNFSVKTLEQLLTTAKHVPVTNQVELHPYLAQEDLRKYCDQKGITLTAYTPSGYATVRADPLIVELSKKYSTTPNQITLAWHIARGTIIVPKSESVERQKQNITLPTLEATDVAKINGLDRGERLCNAPDANGMMYGWTVEQLGW